MTTSLTEAPEFPDAALVVLIGPSGAGKSTLAASWPATQVLSLDGLRGMVSDDPGNQEATPDAADVLKAILESRMKRGLTTVIDATNVEQPVRVDLVMAAKRHGMPAVAVLVTASLSECIARQASRPANRRVPEHVVRAQHEAMTYSQLALETEGFTHVVFARTLPRLGGYLRQLSDAHVDDIDVDDDLAAPARAFGAQILPLWRWKDSPDAVGRGRTAEIRLGQQHLTLALHSYGGREWFEVLVPCPHDPDCEGPAWSPAYSVTDLYLTLIGITGSSGEIACTVHGSTGPEHVVAW